MMDISAHSGIDLLRAMLNGNLPRPAMAATMDFTLTEVSDGEAVFRGVPGPAHLNPMQAVHGGWYGTLLDSAMGCAVQTKLAPGQTYTTLEYKVNVTRAIPPGTEVVCKGHVQHAGRTTAVARAEIVGADDGRTYGTGSTTCLIMGMAR